MLEMALEMLLTKRELTMALKVLNKCPASPVESSLRLDRLMMKSLRIAESWTSASPSPQLPLNGPNSP